MNWETPAVAGDLSAPPPLPAREEFDWTNTEPRYFAVSTTKLVVMSIVTLGLYEVYWFYKNWKLVEKHEEPSIIPWARALFAVFFVHSLFGRMSESSEQYGIEHPTVGLLAVGWILLALLGRAPDPYWLVSFLTPVCLVPMQTVANRINEQVAPLHEKNAQFSGLNVLGILIGGGFLLLSLIGLTMPEM